MPKIGPKMTVKQLLKHAKLAQEGKAGDKGLPPVKTDAYAAKVADPKDPKSPYYGSKWHDPKGHEANRKLAKRIDAAMKTLKKADKDGSHFVLAWRLYPNKEHPRWNRDQPHACGCGCGGAAPLPDL
jgi:hypothetical protein